MKKYFRRLLTYYRYINFSLLKLFFGFEIANTYLSAIDKYSLIYILSKNGAVIGVNCDIESGLILHNCKDFSNLIIGDYCHIGKGCFFDLRDKIILNDRVTISMRCNLITHIDVSYSKINKKYSKAQGSIVILSDSYIGVNSTILFNVKIEQYNLIAANSLVLKNTEPNSAYAGSPVKKIKNI